jgi:hypothetical protein
MGLAAAIRAAVEAVRVATEGPAGLQVNVTHEAWVGKDGRAKPIYATAVSRAALVQYRRPQEQRTEGQPITHRAILSFLGPIQPVGIPGRREPVDPRDKFTLPDGTTGPIVDVQSMPAADNHAPYLTVVYLG